MFPSMPSKYAASEWLYMQPTLQVWQGWPGESVHRNNEERHNHEQLGGPSTAGILGLSLCRDGEYSFRCVSVQHFCSWGRTSLLWLKRRRLPGKLPTKNARTRKERWSQKMMTSALVSQGAVQYHQCDQLACAHDFAMPAYIWSGRRRRKRRNDGSCMHTRLPAKFWSWDGTSMLIAALSYVELEMPWKKSWNSILLYLLAGMHARLQTVIHACDLSCDWFTRVKPLRRCQLGRWIYWCCACWTRRRQMEIFWLFLYLASICKILRYFHACRP